MSQFDIVLVASGVLILLLGLVSGAIRRTVLAEPLIATGFGVALGPVGLELLDVSEWGSESVILEQGARLTLAIGLMGVALRLPKNDPLRRWRSLGLLLGLVMPFMWIASGLLVYLIIGLPFWMSMLIGAVITPTDPIVATSIVTGSVAEENLPADLRHTLSEESGANDGLAHPFVILPILVLGSSLEDSLGQWLTHALLWETGGAVIFGVAAGYFAGRLLVFAESKEIIETTSFLGYTLALSLAILGGAKLLGVNDILPVFLAGIAFDTVVGSSERQESERVQEAVNRFFTLPIFILLGLVLPWGDWAELGWSAVLLIVGVLLLRRLPAMLVLGPLLGRVRGAPEALFMGWFGPIGIAALYYAQVGLHETGQEEVWIIASLIIASSVAIHGLTATPLTQLYGRRVR